jgi:hypothetical protein
MSVQAVIVELQLVNLSGYTAAFQGKFLVAA